jgi:glycosyltransferase involved in cell wall biosynthesis
MKVLFISRAYPPVVGGMENQNYEISRVLPHHVDQMKTIANTAGKRALPVFMPYALIYALINMRKYDALLLGDGVLSIIGLFVKTFYGKKKKVICVNHGLDLTFKHPVYQNFWVRQFIPECDKIIAVGNETINAGVSRGVPEDKFIFVPNGVNVSDFPMPENGRDRTRLAEVIDREITADTRIVYTGGRLAKRKGAAWFVRNVMPKLPENVIYVISGDGPDRENIKEAIKENDLQDRVIMLGYVSDAHRTLLLHNADIFVQPNIQVEDDMEGFGMVILEAGASGIPVLASALEGLKDAIHDGKNGILVTHSDAEAWSNAVRKTLSDNFDRDAFGRSARTYIEQTFQWDEIMKQYAQVIEETEAL